jgi:hypothetical protein
MLFNSRRELLGNLLAVHGGSMVFEKEGFWLRLPPGAVCVSAHQDQG